MLKRHDAPGRGQLIKGLCQGQHMPEGQEGKVIRVGGYTITVNEVTKDGSLKAYGDEAFHVWYLVYLLRKQGWSEEQLVRLLDELLSQ